MKLFSRISAILCTLVLVAYGWFSVLSMKSDDTLQRELYQDALSLMENNIYVRAQPLLEEALSYDGDVTKECERALKEVYLQLHHLNGYSKKYVTLSENVVKDEDASAAEFLEFAEYYFSVNKPVEAISVLSEGVARTDDAELKERYEETRYIYTVGRYNYENVTEIFEKTIQVEQDGKWGIAKSDGSLVISCEYDKVSTFHNGSTIVRLEEEVYSIDMNGSKLYITEEKVIDFTNFSDNRFAFTTESGLYRANGELASQHSDFSFIGTYHSEYAAAQSGEKWGIIDKDAQWVIDARYDGIIMDELGRAVSQGSAFVKQGENVLQLTGTETLGTTYEEAKPFQDSYYAAVKNEGKWGFVDKEGSLVIPYQYDDAKSFGQHLAAVKIGDLWGYISVSGAVVIEPQFEDAKTFSNNSAPVKQDDLWMFITLLEE